MIGTTIQGYEIISVIGEGGMGTVYLARHKRLDRLFAIKALDSKLTRSDEFINRFVREAQRQLEMKHENIVTLHTLIEHDGMLLLVLEYVEGQSLGTLISEQKQMDERRAVAITSQILKGLEHAHSKGIIHRDIKPANILLTGSGVPKLTDFGIAITVDGTRFTRTDGLLGTPHYMSPEQIKTPKKVDARSDIYAMGILLFELLAGQTPFEADTDGVVYIKQIQEVPPDIRTIRPGVSTKLAEAINKALSKKPEDRFANAAEFIRAIGGEGNEQRRKDTFIQEQLKYQTIDIPKKKSPFWLYSIIALLVVAVVAGGIWFKTRNQAPVKDLKDKTTGMEFVLVKGGCFQMGDTFGDGSDNEKPVHEVCVDDFYMGKYEVTVGQFKKFVEAKGYKSDAEIKGDCWTVDDKGNVDNKKGADWRNPGFPQSDTHPVACISWNDADAFARWQAEKSGSSYRLPTETEWEYAARSGAKGYKYSWGNGEPPSGNIADESLKKTFKDWTVWKGYVDGYVFTAPVGSFKPNELGLYDMTGNVWEWVSDWYDGKYYAATLRMNPTGPEKGDMHVLRGGSWNNDPVNLRASIRFWPTPGHRTSNLGFRLVCPLR